MQHAASLQAETISRLFNAFNIAAAAMLLLVVALVTYICIKYRQRRQDESEGAQTTGNNLLEAVMIILPAILLGWFFYESIITEKTIAPVVRDTRQPDVIITGHQWWWEAEYPAAKVTTANEIHLPAGRHLLLEMRSADVIHDWWVPELGNKTDLIPGTKNYLWVDIKKTGDYTGACSEFCGAQHAWMRIHVIAESEEDFAHWLDKNTGTASQPADSMARAGAVLFQSGTCADCHRIGGTPAIARVGPDLTHVGSRQELLTGLIPMNEQALADWIDHPQRIKPGARMPDFILNKGDVQAIAHYLGQLK
ncbi:MAG TPA: cytochrome c oxidase subunit II [Puia sp.]|jgi:cytochrome c oxidase subunit 2